MKHSELKAQMKKEQILEITLEIVRKKGYSGVTMEEIASELLMTKGSLYYYFKNKSDLLFECHKTLLTQATEEFEKILNSDEDILIILKKMVSKHIENAFMEKETFNLLVSPKQYFDEEQLKNIVVIRNNYEELFKKAFQKGYEQGKFQCRDFGMARLFILGGMNWIQEWYNPQGRLSKEEIKELYYHFILKILT